jgi:hypothetical protein
MQDGDSDVKPLRPWREIADELAQERNPERVHQLVTELGHALDSQAIKKPSQSIPKVE